MTVCAHDRFAAALGDRRGAERPTDRDLRLLDIRVAPMMSESSLDALAVRAEGQRLRFRFAAPGQLAGPRFEHPHAVPVVEVYDIADLPDYHEPSLSRGGLGRPVHNYPASKLLQQLAGGARPSAVVTLGLEHPRRHFLLAEQAAEVRDWLLRQLA